MRSIYLLAALTALGPLGCSTEGDAPAGGQDLASASQKSTANTGMAYAKRIESTTEFVGGPRADAQIGDFIMENSRIRVAIQDFGRGIGFDLYGGHILDADVVRAPGEGGQDLMGEVMTAINLHTVTEGEAMTVEVSGQPDQPARLQLRGKTTSFPLFAPKEPMEAWDFDVVEDYILEPDVPWIEIRTTITNNGNRAVALYPGDLLFLGTNLTLSSQGLDYGDGAGKVPYLTAHHEELKGASYGWTSSASDMIVPFEDASQTGALGKLRRIRRGDSRTYTRYLLVGDLDSASVTDAYYQLKAKPTGHLDGVILDHNGAGAEDIQIIVRDTDGGYITDIRTRAGGQFAADLPPGDYQLAFASEAYAVPADQSVSITVNQTRELALQAGPSGLFSLSCQDETNTLAPCRAVITPSGGKRQFHFTASGALNIPLSPGSYSLMVSQGIERELTHGSFTIESGQTTTRSASVARVIDTPGWISMDSHLHAMKSNDSGTPYLEKVRRLVAEGVEIAIATDHDRVSDYTPAVEALGVESRIKTVIGNESSVLDYGHFNVFPLVIDENDPTYYEGSQFWNNLETGLPMGASELFAKMRLNPGEEVIQINHPRDGAKGYLDMIGYNPNRGRAVREPLAEDFDAMEVQKSVFGEDAVLIDFFSMLNQGLTPTAVGSSDAHEASDHNGIPRTYLAVADDRPQAVSHAEMVAAVHQQEAVVSTGIFIDIIGRSGANQEVGPGGMLSGREGPVTLDITLQSPLWAAMDHFTLYQNGEPLALAFEDGRFVPADGGALEVDIPVQTLSQRHQADFEIEVSPPRDAYYVLVAWGDTAQALSGDLPLGYSNPIYVDREDDGYDPPGLRKIGPLPAWPEGTYRRGGHHHHALDR